MGTEPRRSQLLQRQTEQKANSAASSLIVPPLFFYVLLAVAIPSWLPPSFLCHDASIIHGRTSFFIPVQWSMSLVRVSSSASSPCACATQISEALCFANIQRIKGGPDRNMAQAKGVAPKPSDLHMLYQRKGGQHLEIARAQAAYLNSQVFQVTFNNNIVYYSFGSLLLLRSSICALACGLSKLSAFTGNFLGK